MSSVIKFGTDGWRAVIAEDYTFSNVRLVSQAVAQYLNKDVGGNAPVIIGYDTRFGSEYFAQAAAEVLAANGIKVVLTDRCTPTPAVSLAVIEQHLRGGIVITASHNPGIWNGFKYKPDYGGSASPEVIAKIEAELAGLQPGDVQRMPIEEAKSKGLVELQDVGPAYRKRLSELVDVEALKSRQGTVVYDAMFGAGIGHLPQLLSGGNLKVVEINNERNPIFPGMHAPEPIALNLRKLCETVPQAGASLGIATDGDADRVGIVDERGEFVDQLKVYALIAYYLLEVRGQRGPLVKTISQSYMVNRLGALYNVPVYETPVGFKYVGPKMMEADAILGGEESGGFGFKGHIPERDGTLAGLVILDLVMHLGLPLSKVIQQIEEKVGKSYYKRIDLTFPAEQRSEIIERLRSNPPETLLGQKVVKFQTEDGFKYTLENDTWLLIRFSGTEPVIRIYTETDSPDKLDQMLNEGRKLAGV